MVIAKSGWFVRRKYLGWGLMPKTWQGWLYALMIVVVFGIVINLPIDMNYKIIIYVLLGIFLFIDLGNAMINIKDEREKIHEAIAERNALWAMITVIAVGVGYQVASSVVKNSWSAVDPFLIAAVVVALAVKAISNIWLDRKN